MTDTPKKKKKSKLDIFFEVLEEMSAEIAQRKADFSDSKRVDSDARRSLDMSIFRNTPFPEGTIAPQQDSMRQERRLRVDSAYRAGVRPGRNVRY